jgi:hypothetical protein
MALYRIVVGGSKFVFKNNPSAFAFNAEVPTLGAYSMPSNWIINEVPYLTVNALGGPPASGQSETITLQFRLNATPLGAFQFPRFPSHTGMPGTQMIVIPRGILRLRFIPPFPVPNVLNVESLPLNSSDYFWLGPVVCHYGA